MSRVKFIIAALAALFVSTLGAGAAKAQTVRLYNTRGQEIRSGNPFPLDRFARGETCVVKVWNPDGWAYYDVVSRRGFEFGGWDFPNYTEDRFQIPLDPNADYMKVRVYNYSRWRWIEYGIPIGRK